MGGTNQGLQPTLQAFFHAQRLAARTVRD